MGQQLLLGLCLLLLTLIGAGCSTTKNLPEGEVLYEGIKRVTIAEQDPSDDGENTVSEINAALAYPPNNALLGSSSIRIPLPVGLWVYNAFVNKKGKIGQWIFKKFAAKPVLISTVNPEVRVKVAQNLLREYGYFQGSTGFEILRDEKNPRKAKIAYEIHMGKAYTLDDIRYIRMRRRTDSIIQSTAALSKLKAGDNFNVVRLQEERERIAALLRDNGYFYYRPDFITYDADTLLSPGKVSLRVKPKEGLPIRALRPWRIGDISLHLSGYQNEPPTDSIRYKDLTIHYEGKLRVRPKVIYDRLFFKSGELYSQDKQEQSQTALSRLGIFRYTDMQYTPRDTTRRQDTLDLRINATYDLPIDGELEVNVTSKSNDQVGPGAVFSVTKRNIFGGGETFNVQMKGSYEWQTGNKLDNNSSKINSYELGLSATLKFPRILFPVQIPVEHLVPDLCGPDEPGPFLQAAGLWRRIGVRVPAHDDLAPLDHTVQADVQPPAKHDRRVRQHYRREQGPPQELARPVHPGDELYLYIRRLTHHHEKASHLVASVDHASGPVDEQRLRHRWKQIHQRGQIPFRQPLRAVHQRNRRIPV